MKIWAVLLIACSASMASANPIGTKTPAKEPARLSARKQEMVVIRILRQNDHGAPNWASLKVLGQGTSLSAELELIIPAKEPTRKGPKVTPPIGARTLVQRIPSGLASMLETESLRLIWDLKFREPASVRGKCVAFAELTVTSTGDRLLACGNQPEHVKRVGSWLLKVDRLHKSNTPSRRAF
ncbi:MAG: hypothetical protein NDI61_10870 [Bdellovibrionaceae bacterium]|nr:hypothetical protein [Pseudobdellovibrionaceae bacterium]